MNTIFIIAFAFVALLGDVNGFDKCPQNVVGLTCDGSNRVECFEAIFWISTLLHRSRGNGGELVQGTVITEVVGETPPA